MTSNRSLRSVALASCLLPAACGGGSGKTAAPPGDEAPPSTINIDGSSIVFPVTEAVAEAFQKERRGVRVTVGISDTRGGFQKLCRGETDIAGASRPINPAEVEACARSGVAFTELPIACDALAVVVHPKNAWAHSMTVAELEKVWEPTAQGKIVRWSQIRTGWPSREIHLVGPGKGSGSFDYFTEAIVGKEGAGRSDVTSSENDNVLAQAVSNDELALGVVRYGSYERNKGRLKLVPLDDGKDENGKGPVAPSPDTVRNGTYQPLARPIFIYVSHEAAGREEVEEFVDYYLVTGQSVVREAGYVPLNEPAYRMAQQRFQARKPGSMFAAGDAHVGVDIQEVLAKHQ